MASPRNSTTTSKGRYYTREGQQYWSITTRMGDGVPKKLEDWAATMAALSAYKGIATLQMLKQKGGAFTKDYHEWKHLWWDDLTDHDRAEVKEWSGVVLKTGKVDEVPAEYAAHVAVHILRTAHLRDRDQAASKGSKLHDYAEKVALDPSYERQVPDYLVPYVKAFREFADETGVQFEASEFSVYSDRHMYAGTGDFIAHFDNLPELGRVLGDYKTGKSGLFADVGLQLNALVNADYIDVGGQQVEIPNIDNLVAVHIHPDGWELRQVEMSDEVFNYFLSACEVAKWAKEKSKEVLSAPIKPRKKVLS